MGPGHAEEQELVLEDASPEHGKSVIIELEDGNPGQTDGTDKKPLKKIADEKKKPGRRQIELIVGGQGEDGVAKRSKLIVND